MALLRKKSSFTLTLVPDSGIESKSGNINYRIIAGFFSSLVAIFLLCLFFIIGYHVKLYQEMGYKAAISVMKQHLATIESTSAQLNLLAAKITKLQELDIAYRQYASMSVPDANMYLAGVGGHAIVDDSGLEGINRNLGDTIRDLLITANSIDRKITLEQTSFQTISESVEKQKDIVRNTPDILPCKTLKISSVFGTRTNPVTGRREFHDAVDFNGVMGDKILATADGMVVTAGYHPTRGNYVEIQHKYGYKTGYAHLNTILVSIGQVVKKHDTIGTMGRTGRATGVNLHYSISQNNRTMNPIDYF